MNLLTVIPYCAKDSKEAARLLEWIFDLDGQITNHALLLVADDAVPLEEKKRLHELGRTVFGSVETIMPKCPASVNGAYQVPAAAMFGRAAAHIDACYKFNWVWLEPDAVPLCSGWLDRLAAAYEACPKRFMGAVVKTTQPGVPQVHMPATMVYPNCAGPDLQKYCDGKMAFDMAFADYVVPRGQETPLIFHRFGSPSDVPTFKETKLPSDGPNVGTLENITKEAVLFHRNKDGTLIKLLGKMATPAK
jgi:hypothetical protein